MSSTSTPRRVSKFISRVMIDCSSAWSSPAVGNKDGQFLIIDPGTATIAVRLGRSDGRLWMGQWAGLFAQLAGSARETPPGR